MKMHEIIINKEKCTGCGMCKKECVAYNLTIEEKKAKAIANDCVMCGHCVAVCPKGAIAISGYDTEPIEKEQETFLNPEDVMNVIRFRRTVRQFKEKQIPQEVIEQILEAGRLTHTARNKQDVSFIVLDKEKDKVEEYAVGFVHKIKPVMNLFSPMIRRNKIGNHFFFYQAPIVIIITAKDKINGILAAQNMEFVAEANGLGVLFSGFFTNAANVSYKIKKILGIQKGKKVVATLVIGYPKVKYQRSVQREKIDVKYR